VGFFTPRGRRGPPRPPPRGPRPPGPPARAMGGGGEGRGPRQPRSRHPARARARRPTPRSPRPGPGRPRARHPPQSPARPRPPAPRLFRALRAGAGVAPGFDVVPARPPRCGRRRRHARVARPPQARPLRAHVPGDRGDHHPRVPGRVVAGGGADGVCVPDRGRRGQPARHRVRPLHLHRRPNHHAARAPGIRARGAAAAVGGRRAGGRPGRRGEAGRPRARRGRLPRDAPKGVRNHVGSLPLARHRVPRRQTGGGGGRRRARRGRHRALRSVGRLARRPGPPRRLARALHLRARPGEERADPAAARRAGARPGQRDAPARRRQRPPRRRPWRRQVAAAARCHGAGPARGVHHGPRVVGRRADGGGDHRPRHGREAPRSRRHGARRPGGGVHRRI